MIAIDHVLSGKIPSNCANWRYELLGAEGNRGSVIVAKHYVDMDDDLLPGRQDDSSPLDAGEVPQSDLPDLPVLKSSYDRENLIRVRKKRKGRITPLKIGLAIAAASLLLIVGIVVYWIFSLDRSLDMDDSEREALLEALAVHEGNDSAVDNPSAFYVLIVGSDAREGVSGARGDVLMLCRIDPDAGTVHLISIPRDTMIYLGGGDVEKINAAFANGGAAYAVRAVSKFAGVPISHYVEVDFEGLVEVVDLVGGVWVDIPEPFSVAGYSFNAGRQLLNGQEALVYARQRYSFSGGDFTRTQSQRQIAQGIIDQILVASPVELPGIISSVAGMISTDYSVSDFIALALKFRESGVKLYSTICPSYTLWQDDVSYVGTMYDEWADLMKRVDAGLDPNDTSVPIPEPQASNPDLGAASNAASPRDYHHLVDEAGLTTDDIDTPE